MSEPDWTTSIPEHRVAFDVDRESCTARIECEAPGEAQCRLVCAEECGAETWPCYGTLPDGSEYEHTMRDAGFCNVVEFIHGADLDAAVAYDGEYLRDAKPGPVEVRWDGDTYVWRFPLMRAQAKETP